MAAQAVRELLTPFEPCTCRSQKSASLLRADADGRAHHQHVVAHQAGLASIEMKLLNTAIELKPTH
ncbi:hypothetical protein [Methylobacterium oxalidis]|uniref:hypothetical protein n=1 Tax=Methylobacterium oxalidis TaxID=944322 RepID=UPI0033145507